MIEDCCRDVHKKCQLTILSPGVKSRSLMVGERKKLELSSGWALFGKRGAISAYCDSGSAIPIQGRVSLPQICVCTLTCVIQEPPTSVCFSPIVP